ncbi:MAG: hypothetical protein SYNGOMJ08_00019 [Candidatus Syntrophoarchaeum sp. GoM_oil]|nr:MAG: hypothetical protein SYNGOMJ08_00019 [Candidatus Syntrophoarchaeum sp. GoM_oil]
MNSFRSWMENSLKKDFDSALNKVLNNFSKLNQIKIVDARINRPVYGLGEIRRGRKLVRLYIFRSGSAILAIKFKTTRQSLQTSSPRERCKSSSLLIFEKVKSRGSSFRISSTGTYLTLSRFISIKSFLSPSLMHSSVARSVAPRV